MQLIDSYLKYYCRSYLHCSFSTKETVFDRKNLTVKLISPSLSSQGKTVFSADSIDIPFNIDWKKKALVYGATLDHPYVDLREIPFDYTTLITDSSSLLSQSMPIIGHDGTLIVDDVDKYFFDSSLEVCPQFKGRVNLLSSNSPASETQKGEFYFHLNADGSGYIRTNLEQFQSASLLKMSGFTNSFLRDIRSTSGTISGECDLFIDLQSKIHADGLMNLNNIHLQYLANNSFFHIPQASLRFSSNGPNSQAVLAFSQPSSVVHYGNQSDPWHLTNLTGEIALNNNKELALDLNGYCYHRSASADLIASGFGHYTSSCSVFFDLSLGLKDQVSEDFNLRLRAGHLNDPVSSVEIALKNLGREEFTILRPFLCSYFEECKLFEMSSGLLDIDAIAYLENSRLTDIKVDRVSAHNLGIKIHAIDSIFNFEQLFGEAYLDLSAPTIIEGLQAELFLNDSSMRCDSLVYGCQLFSKLKSKLVLLNGILQQSTIEGEFLGLKGTINLIVPSDTPKMTLNFKGPVNDLMSAFPQLFSDDMLTGFKEDTLQLTAQVYPIRHGLHINGKGEFINDLTQKLEKILFGFDLHKNFPQIFPQSLPPSFITAVSFHSFTHGSCILPWSTISSPLISVASSWLENELGFNAVTLHHGWFFADSISLKKYLTPYLFPTGSFSLSGNANIHGAFDQNGATVSYECDNAQLENDFLTITVPAIGSQISRIKNCSNGGYHYFDFNNGSHWGCMPLKGGSYFDKNYGALFTDINAQVIYEKDKVLFKGLEAVSDGINFSGSILVDYSRCHESFTDIDIKMPKCLAMASQTRQFLNRFGLPFLPMPFEGLFQTIDDGLHITFQMMPDKCLYNLSYNGMLSNGSYLKPDASIFLRDLSGKIAFNSNNKQLTFDDIQGSVTLNNTQNAEKLALAGGFHLDDFIDKTGSFDFWLSDKQRDIFRIKGVIEPNIDDNEKKEERVRFVFDKEQTHLGPMHPDVLDLELNELNQIHAFEFAAKTSLQQFSVDFLRFFPDGNFKESYFNDSLNGNLSTYLSYSKDASEEFVYKLSIDNLTYQKQELGLAKLYGTKKGSVWSIDEFSCGRLSLSTQFSLNDAGCKLDFLGAKFTDHFLIGLKGAWNYASNAFDANVDLLEINLNDINTEKLQRWPLLAEAFNGYTPQGYLKGKGYLKVQKSLAGRKWHVDTLLNCSLKEFGALGICFDNANDVLVRFNSAKGLLIENLASNLLDDDRKTVLGALSLDTVAYDIRSKEFLIDSMHFDIPHDKISTSAEKFKFFLKDGNFNSFVTTCATMKSEGSLQGDIKAAYSDASYSFNLSLKDGSYHLWDQDHVLSDFSLHIVPQSISLLTHYQIHDHTFWIMGLSPSLDLAKGKIVLSDVPQKPLSFTIIDDSCLVIDWKRDKDAFNIISANGQFCGLKMALKATEIPYQWQGDIAFDFPSMQKLLSHSYQEQIASFQFGDGYSLSGIWQYLSVPEGIALSGMCFDGRLSGRNFSVNGLHLQNLDANVKMTPSNVSLSDFVIHDEAIKAHLPLINLQYNSAVNDWFVTAPALQINDLIPCLLKSVDGSYSYKTNRNLIVKQIDIGDFGGFLSDSTTYKGIGSLVFSNQQKKSFQNPLFAIPAEILTRLGLDLAVLTPVMGTINFDIHNAKVFITRFKDIYSHGKMSKFYLPSNTNYLSYMDFDGNLHLQVRMKQYNLLFKLAELFTVTIQGTLENPTYTLQKQHTEKDTVNSA